ncbi:hypothetical protein [Adhaeribacter rhizoryzae]|uniref:Uncharacterized protein n=1 Tax=Adhaeribacter rhizoryzae TaxID=2607907 RepID=A0A5M6DPI7_9BACT|nr:hypothetical protein [Adhaeribacter rhizoryzae]KAA5548100.1 hypothetical protein F0145_05070 [Adhaeribacter rhizoryzae]
MKNVNALQSKSGKLKGKAKISKEAQAYLDEVNQKIDAFRAGKLKESLKALGFTFTSAKAFVDFNKKRITSINFLDSPGKVRLYLDYGTPNRVMLAEYNTGEIKDNGEIQVRDSYYEAPKAGANENELHIQYL